MSSLLFFFSEKYKMLILMKKKHTSKATLQRLKKPDFRVTNLYFVEVAFVAARGERNVA